MTTYPKPQDRVRVLDLDLILMPVVEYGRLTETIQFSSVQFSSKNFNHPTRDNVVVVMAGL